jgi:signal peptide peptidase SppA
MQQIFATLFNRARWLIEPYALRDLMRRALAATPESIQAATVAAERDRRTTPQMVGDVAVIHVCGVISYKPSWFSYYFGGATIEEMQAQFRAALSDTAVRAIVFRMDSPGGIVDMVPEFADEVFAARGQKPILAVADTMICSAAYWIAAQADLIYATGSSQVGSIGVYLEHQDISKFLEELGVNVTLIQHGAHKTDGNPYAPLSDAVLADLQSEVDEIGAEFEAAVARGRKVPKATVLESFGQGKVFRGKQAISLGLADKLATYGQAMGKISKGRASGSTSQVHVDVIDEVNVHQGTVLLDAFAASASKRKAEDPIEPDENGQCQDGYELGDDGLCHLVPADDDTADETKQAEADAVGIAAVLSSEV